MGGGAAVGGRSLFCVVHASCWCLASFIQERQPAAAGHPWWGHTALSAVVGGLEFLFLSASLRCHCDLSSGEMLAK